MDGIGEGHYQSDAIALEESEVCIIRYDAFENLARQIPALQNQFHKIMSRELTQDQRHLLSLGTMRAEERLASFLLNLSQRLAARGYLNNEFDLKMIRGKIHDWALFQDKLSSIAKMQINKYLDKGNGTLADIVNSIINDYKR